MSTTPLARSAAAHRAASTVSAKSIVATVWLRSDGLATNGVAKRARLGPAVEDLGRAVAAPGRELEAALVEHPAHGVRSRRKSDPSAGVLYVWSRREFSSVIVQARATPAPSGRIAPTRSMRSIGGRRQQREPEPAVGGERLLRREVVGVELRRVDAHPGRGGRAVDQHEAVGVGAAARRPSRRSTVSLCGNA